MDLLQNSAVTIGLVAAIITGLGVIWIKAVKPFYRRVRAGIHMIQRVTKDADRLLPFAEEQLKTNGGSTFKDQIDRIDALTLGNHKSAEEHWRKLDQRLSDVAQLVEARHGEVTARLATIEKHLEPSGLPVAVTISDGPVPVTIVESEEPDHG